MTRLSTVPRISAQDAAKIELERLHRDWERDDSDALAPARGILIALALSLAMFAAIGLTWFEIDRLVAWSGLNDLPPIPARSQP